MLDYIDRWVLESCVKAYAAGADVRDPWVSPLFTDLRGLPAMLVQGGNVEALANDARHLVSDASEGMVHVWHFFAALLRESRDAIDHLGDFVRAQVPVREPLREVA